MADPLRHTCKAALLAGGLLLSGAQPSLGLGPEIALNEAQRAYLQRRGPVTLCVDPDWSPYEIINERGRHEGIAADLLDLVAARTGLSLQLVATSDWRESLDAAREGRCEILSFLNRTPAREEWLDFTSPVFSDPNVIIAREEEPFVTDLSAMAGAIVALPEGTSVEERLRRDYPDLRIVLTATEAEAFAMVAEREADLTIRSLIVAVDTIKRDGWFSLRVAGQVPDQVNDLRIGVRKGDALLAEILEAGVASITPAERREIANRHTAIMVATRTDYRLVWLAAGGFVIVLLTSLFWIVYLNRANRRLHAQAITDALTGLFNRQELDRELADRIMLAGRQCRPLAVMMIDIDHFKRVNDRFGHQVGDQVLVAMAGIMQASVRESDIVGRWGGEEFMVICPETSGQEALAVAERLRQAVAIRPFPVAGRVTVSVGIAELNPGESVESLANNADAALYRAKAGGRNRVVGPTPAVESMQERSQTGQAAG